MEPEVATDYAIDTGPVVNHTIVAVQRKPGGTVRGVDVLKHKISDGTDPSAGFAVDNVVSTGRQRTDIGLVDSVRIIAAYTVSGQQKWMPISEGALAGTRITNSKHSVLSLDNPYSCVTAAALVARTMSKNQATRQPF